MTIYVTKYFLSKGCVVFPTGQYEIDSDGWALIKQPKKYCYFAALSPGNFFTDRAEAQADIDQRRAKKIESLRKQIAKLEKPYIIPEVEE